MLDIFLKFFAKMKSNISEPSHVYKESFDAASKFTKEKNFKPDSDFAEIDKKEFKKLLSELSGMLPEVIAEYKSKGLVPIHRFGADCGNVHFTVLKHIKKYYPCMSANITIGEVLTGNQTCFKFDQKKCQDWLKDGSPEILDCHTWITIGKDCILDCTIGTYINTRIDPDHKNNINKNVYGGLIYGSTINLNFIAFANQQNKTPQDYKQTVYSPVILGLQAFNALAPKQQQPQA